ncbi:RNA-directed DNA polymerase, eukaryota, partial [Tanacetum coccineum]
MSNDDESNLVGGSLGSNPEKSDEPTTGHVNDGDTPTKDGSGESDGSYASTFPAQGCKKENSKFVMNHVSPYMDDGKHVNEGIEATERSLSSQLGEQVGSRKPRPTKIELEKIIAYSQWLNENEFIKSICEGFISGKACWDGTPPKHDLQDHCQDLAFDSVRWDYLDGVLNNFGFGVKWRAWIQACLSSVMGSILVNESPSSEFKFHKGLKQGDPLSPFLFILVMESLHISFNNILNSGLYKGIRIDESLTLSHLFYADDAVFIGKWDKANVITIVGSSSSRSNFWDEVIAKLSSRLSKWKIKMLSIGGRFTLNKAVLSSLPIYLMSIYKTPVGVLRKMESIRRRFFNGADINENKMSMIGWFGLKDSSLWYRVIKAMFGDGGALENTGKFARSSIWTTIVHECGNLSSKEKINASSISCSFRRLPRGSLEEEQFSKLIEDVNSVILSVSNDRWIWSLDSS